MNITNSDSSIRPSVRLTMLTFVPSTIRSSPHINSAIDDNASIGRSLKAISELILTGAIMAIMPIMRVMSKMLAPRTSPSASSDFPESVDMKHTTKSGVEEPKATMVRPITRLDMPNRLATDTAPSVR
nr:hypothetical protein [Muribaculum intestinale]